MIQAYVINKNMIMDGEFLKFQENKMIFNVLNQN